MQKLLTQEEQGKLYAWINHASNTLSPTNPKAMATFIRSLVNRGAEKHSFLAYLRSFGVENANEFIDELFQRIQDKNFDFVEEAKPVEPPPKPALPPKETKPEPEPKPKRDEPKPKTEKKPREDDKRRDRQSDERRKDSDRRDRRDRRDSTPDRHDRRDRRDDSPERRYRRDKRDDSPERRDRRDRRDDSPDRRGDSPDRKDRRDERRRDKWSGFKEKMRQRRSRYRDSDEESDKDAEPEVAPPPKYIIYIAGLEPHMNVIPGLLKSFGKYGRILAIETMPEQGVAFIEYDQLLGAFRACIAKKNPLGNSYIRIGYAKDPDPEALAALQREYEERTRKWNEEKERKRLERENAQKQKETPALDVDDSARELLADLVAQQQAAITELEQCTDPEQKKLLEERVTALDEMLQELYPDPQQS